MCCSNTSKFRIYYKIRAKLLQLFGTRGDQTYPNSNCNAAEAQEGTELEPLQSMSTKRRNRTAQVVPEDDNEWIQLKNSTFVLEKVHNLVQVFQERAEKIKERINQPPTPSPTPPPDSSPDKLQEHQANRPRLESLIQQEDDDDDDISSGTLNLGCCHVKKSYIPTFPAVLDPQSKIYISWLFFVMLSYVYNAWVIVLRAVFPYQTPDNLPIFLTFDYIADIVYVIDIAVFKVRLRFLQDGFWVDDPERTRQNYLKKILFKMDVLSLLPLDLLYFIYGTNPLFRLPRLLKTQTFWEFFHRVDAVAKAPYVIRIIRTLLYMMYLIHLNACAYYAMSTWEGIGSNGWVFQGVGNAYIRCCYFATKTATSIGKNPKPENEYEYVFMTISWLMGVFIFAFLIGQIRDIVATATQSKTQYRQLMDQTVMYMRNLSLPDDLQRRVRLWLNHTWEQQKTLNEGGILDSLPRKMKTDVAINVHYNTLVKVQLFKDCDKALLRDLVLQLKPVLFLPGDYICRKGEVGKEMYILNKGLVQVTDGEKGEIVLATLSEGSVFGEISLLGISGCSRRTADVRSQGFSNLFVLSKDDLWEALKNYPEAQKVLRKKAKMLIKENEARDRASKSSDFKTSRLIIKHNTRRPSTPQLLKTVIQVIPKESKCAQLITRKPRLSLPSVESVLSGSCRNVRKDAVRKSLPSVTPLIQTDKTSNSSMNLETSPSQEIHINSEKTNLEESQQDKTKEPLDILKTMRDLIPEEFCKKQLDQVHPQKEQQQHERPIANSSEDSGISMDMKLCSSMIPIQKNEDCYSTCDSEDTISSRRAGIRNPEDVQEPDEDDQPQNSPTQSVFNLKTLFRTSSSNSYSLKNTFANETDVTTEPYQRSASLTSSSTSVGYDNLAFVPVDVLSSRRSSVFSDTSC